MARSSVEAILSGFDHVFKTTEEDSPGKKITMMKYIGRKESFKGDRYLSEDFINALMISKR